MGEISVIVVSWNARDYLRNCLASIRQTSNLLVQEVIVVDNASSDGSPEMVSAEFPEVTLIRSGTNLGFARANNLGLHHSSGALVAFVNSDVVVHAECFQKLAGFLKNQPGTALVAPRIFGRDGQVQATCGRLPTIWNTLCEYLLLYKVFPRWRLFSGFQIRMLDPGLWARVEVLSGCFWLTRRVAVDQVGSLDERFFFYAEDIDWCKRFREAGWKVAFVPEATATHFGGGSSSNAPFRYSIEMLRANLLYWKKHRGSVGRSAFFVLAMLQHFPRLVVRGILGITGLDKGDENKHKLTEHKVCIRWLLTGKGV
jgi:GT2 family glycosyltransferase